MDRKTRDAVFICGGEEHGTATTVRLDHRFDDCPNASQHAPFPDGYMGFHGLLGRRAGHGQRSSRCPDCGLFVIFRGGRDVPGWPRQTALVGSGEEPHGR